MDRTALDETSRKLYSARVRPSTVIVCTVLPAVLGFVVAGVAAVTGMGVDAAFASLVVGACVTGVVAFAAVVCAAAVLLRGALQAIGALTVALTMLYKVVARLAGFFESDDHRDDANGDVFECPDCGHRMGEVVYDQTTREKN